MSCDKLVFDLSQEIEGSPNVFVKKDWLNIIDNMNQNYNSNQSVVDTSQLANSNKYLSYREAYLLVPLVLTLAPSEVNKGFAPATSATSIDYCMGLKNWFGQIIHSFTLDYNGTTTVQQTPFISMVNIFSLMTSFSWNDVITQGSAIGFYPDDPLSWTFATTLKADGVGVCNNIVLATSNQPVATPDSTFNKYESGTGNEGYVRRIQFINFDPAGTPSPSDTNAYSTLLSSGASACNLLWKSYIFNKVNAGATATGMFQIAVSATIYLKHIHSFFSMCPLLKGVFMKMTMNLNNTSVQFTTLSAGTARAGAIVALSSVSNAVGGVCPLMISSTIGGAKNLVSATDATTITYNANVSVGAVCLNSTLAGQGGILSAPLAKSIYLYVPAYTFNPIFEQSYLSSPVKQIKYTDVYQYQVLNVGAGSYFNNLLTNGISNIKSVLIVPLYSSSIADNTGLPTGIPVYQSPYDIAGCGGTSPLSFITNFNVVVSGQNAIYNTQRYNFEEWNNQLYGQNAVNGGMTDGLTSSLVNSLGWEMENSHYYVNVSRMLPIEESVPKSVQIIGQNLSGKSLDLWCFISYGVEVSIDILTGSRV